MKITIDPPQLDENGHFPSVEAMLDHASPENVEKIEDALWEAASEFNAARAAKKVLAQTAERRQKPTDPTTLRAYDTMQEAAGKEYQEIYTTFVAPFISQILPGAPNTTPRKWPLLARSSGIPIGTRVTTNKDAVAGIFQDDMPQAAAALREYFPTRQDRIENVIEQAKVYKKLASFYKLLLKVGQKSDADANAELGKVKGVLDYFLSDAFQEHLELIEKNPQNTVATGGQARDAAGHLITSWDQITGGEININFYPEQVIYQRICEAIENVETFLSALAANYPLGTFVADPVTGEMEGLPIAVRSPSNNSDPAVAYLTANSVVRADQMRRKGATEDDVLLVRNHFMPVVMGYGAKPEEFAKAARFITSRGAAHDVASNRLNSPHLTKEEAVKIAVEADSWNINFIDSTYPDDKRDALIAGPFRKRMPTIGGNGCTKTGLIGIESGETFDKAVDKILTTFRAVYEEHRANPYTSVHDPSNTITPTAGDAKEIREDLALFRDKFGAENVHFDLIMDEWEGALVKTPTIVVVKEDAIPQLCELLKEGKERFYNVTFVFPADITLEKNRIDLSGFTGVVNNLPTRLTGDTHSMHPLVFPTLVRDVPMGSWLNDSPDMNKDKTQKGGHYWLGPKGDPKFDNNAANGTEANIYNFKKGVAQNPLTYAFLNAGDPDLQKTQLALMGFDFEGEAPDISGFDDIDFSIPEWHAAPVR